MCLDKNLSKINSVLCIIYTLYIILWLYCKCESVSNTMDEQIGSKSNANTEQLGSCVKWVDCKKLSKPTLNSALRKRNQLEQLERTKHICSNKDDVDLLIKRKLTKLNFGAHQKVFGNLTPLNVNDSLLLPNAKVPFPKKYMHSNDRIPTPDLRDFLQNIPAPTYVIEEPKIVLESVDYDFDVMLNYKLFKE